MSSINQVFLLGRAGRDTELKGAEGKVATNSLATDYWKGPGQKTTEWHNLVAFGNQVEQLQKVRKGDVVAVMGRINTNEYQADGQTKKNVQIVVNRVVVASGDRTQNETSDPSSGGQDDFPVDQPAATPAQGDLPF
jgi:single stranded DNA-binding protein